MKLAHYDQGKLSISKANMHYGKKARTCRTSCPPSANGA